MTLKNSKKTYKWEVNKSYDQDGKQCSFALDVKYRIAKDAKLKVFER